MTIFSTLKIYVKKINKSIDNFLTGFNGNVENNDGFFEKIFKRFFNFVSLGYFTVRKILLFVLNNPKKSTLLFLTFSPTVLTKQIKQSAHSSDTLIDTNEQNNFIDDTATNPSLLRTAEEKLMPIKNISIENILDRKFKFDLSITSKEQIKNCNQIKKAFLELPKNLPVTKKSLEAMTKEKEFEIICIERPKDKDTVGGFDLNTKKLLLYPDLRKYNYNSTFNHELNHADTFFRHKDQCKVKNLESTAAPLHPVNKKNLEKYQQALDLGDKRLKDFRRLLDKKKQGSKFKKKEEELFEKYTQVSKTCLLDAFITLVSPNIQQTFNERVKLKKKGIKTSPVIIDNTAIGTVEVKEIIYNKIGVFGIMQPFDINYAVTFIPDYVKAALENPTYKNASPVIKFIEREAYTLERLSEEAVKVFYEEVYNLKQEFFAACPNEDERTQKNLSL